MSIRQAAQTCQQGLQNALNRSGPSGPQEQRTWVQRRIVDFNTWANFSGVFREGIYGLDAKLCLRPDLQMGLISLLDVFDALMSSVAGKSDLRSTHEIEDKFSEIVSMTAYVRKSLANTGLWPDKDRAHVAPGVWRRRGPRLAQSLSKNTRTSSESVIIPDQERIISELLSRLNEASFRRNELFAEARKHCERPATSPKPKNVWPPPKTNQFPAVPLFEMNPTTFNCQFCCQDLPAFFLDAYAWR